mmetsp:Transcript_14348/g.40549  ORF Transcript_14348/g.40549 Transcript_14348/m.40549 type:complete len:90 (-) Transcript_14348:161-430(-)
MARSLSPPTHRLPSLTAHCILCMHVNPGYAWASVNMGATSWHIGPRRCKYAGGRENKYQRLLYSFTEYLFIYKHCSKAPAEASSPPCWN